jgi:hypothetical protein
MSIAMRFRHQLLYSSFQLLRVLSVLLLIFLHHLPEVIKKGDEFDMKEDCDLLVQNFVILLELRQPVSPFFQLFLDQRAAMKSY